MPVNEDLRLWPIVRYNWIGEPTIEIILSYWQTRAQALEQKDTHVLIMDFRKMSVPNSVQRKCYLEHYHLYEADMNIKRLATAIITDSHLMRGAITAMNWIGTTVRPTQVFPSAERARIWAEPILAENRLKAPDLRYFD